MRTDTRHLRSGGVARRFVFVALLMAFALVTFDIGAQRADQRAAPPNFDVRTARDPAASRLHGALRKSSGVPARWPIWPGHRPRVWRGCSPTSGQSMW